MSVKLSARFISIIIWLFTCCLISNTDAENSEAPFSKPQRKPPYSIVDERCIYEASWTGRPYKIWPEPEIWWDMHLRVHNAYDLPGSGPWAFNWIVRRYPCFMASGDVPRFALVETPRNKEINPPFYMMGEFRIRCGINGKAPFWLDEQGKIKSTFYPWGTIHNVDLRPEFALGFRIKAVFVENRGIAIEVMPVNYSNEPVDVKLDFYYGGLDSKFINFFPEYFTVDPNDGDNDIIELEQDGSILSDPAHPLKAYITADPIGVMEVETSDLDGYAKNHIVFRHNFSLEKNLQSFKFLVSKDQERLSINEFEKYIQSAKDYYDKLLDSIDIQTPDRILNTAFYASVVNLDYTYQPPGWFEGIHEWNSYFLNNYQISAAICIGQFERARDALMLFGGAPEGPAHVLVSDGSIFKGGHSSEDGLPYFILQLYRYWKATNDTETLNRLWENTCKNLDHMFTVRDPEGNLLLNFHQACNAFLYQADHLSLPGDAISPTLMMTDALEMMSEMAQAQGRDDQARNWRNRAEYMRNESIRRLWLTEEGKFAAAIDYQGFVQHASYYTDYVFPVIYSSIPNTYKWLSLKALDRDLWIGDHLMRTGNFKPDLFGNNAIQPVQMSEASEAYFKQGRSEKGWALLHGTGLGATILTDSPGSFPEFNSTTGWGLPDYAFGNPAAAYFRAVVGGLFGLERTSADKALLWQPSIPAKWENAKLRVGEINLSIQGFPEKRTYSAVLPKAQSLLCRIPLCGYKLKSLTDTQGKDLPHKISTDFVGGLLEICLPIAKNHKFIVSLQKENIDWKVPAMINPGETVKWKLPGENFTLNDPQHVFQTFRIDGDLLKGTITTKTGPRTLFLLDSTNQSNVFDIHIGKIVKNQTGPLIIQGHREHLVLDKLFNSDFIFGRNFWRFGQHRFDFSKYLKDIKDNKGRLTVGTSTFEVLANGQNMVVLEIGSLDPYMLRLIPSDRPDEISFDIGKNIMGIDLLMASECPIRLTSMQIGQINLRYEDGFVQVEPLIYGRNIDSILIPHATNVSIYKLEWSKFVSAFSVAADETRKLDKFDVTLFMPDANIGILAINIIIKD